MNLEEETLVSFDVSALTSILTPVALQIINIPKFYLHQFHQCLQDPYRKNYQASGIHYQQLHLLL